jgi:hypothetical protein
MACSEAPLRAIRSLRERPSLPELLVVELVGEWRESVGVVDIREAEEINVENGGFGGTWSEEDVEEASAGV